TVSDGHGGYDSAMVAVTVTPVCDCAVELEPPAAAQTGDTGTTITYTLRVTNSGDCADVLDVTVVSLWPAEAPATVGPLAAGEGMDVMVTVTVPAGASDGDQDVATVTFTSHGDGSISAASVLTTTVNTPTYRVYLPLVLR
ncbi:MAG TPA: NEW3 domain-containing protein, partial [Rubrivivax sp.]|nr:NEW3 domain-containing protein [Rubrivivax sp.]